MGYRKWLAILVTVVMILALFPAVGVAEENNDKCGEKVVDLIAGQNMEVGTVTVTNDDEKICVTYALDEEAIDEGWEITETHLYIGKNIPPTSVPGQFPYDDDDAEYDNGTVTYCIPLEEVSAYMMALNSQGRPTGVMIVDESVTPGVEHCNDVYIAAHAVIEKCDKVSDTFEPALTWTRNNEPDGGIVVPNLGGTWTPAEGFGIATPNPFVWDGGMPGQYFTGYSTRGDISWASWVCTQAGTPSTTGADLRRFNAAFDIPAGYEVTGGTLSSVNDGYEGIIPINDNIYIFVNQDLLFWGGTLSKFTGTPTQLEGIERRAVENQYSLPVPETDGWYMLGALPAIPDDLFTVGANNLDVFAEEFWTGGGMHELKLDLDVCITTCEDETAWGEGENFGTNWGMFFMYHICVPETVIYPQSGTTTVAYEDLPVIGSDWDYNDWVATIETEATIASMPGVSYLKSMEFDITPKARGAAAQHLFGIVIPAEMFSVDGEYTLVRFDGVGNEVFSETGTFNAAAEKNFIIWPQTSAALPNMSNTNPEGTVSDPLQTAKLSIIFDGDGCDEFDFDDYSVIGIHGEGLFFEPYINSDRVVEDIGVGDIRMLVVPDDWRWPKEQIRIWNAYDAVGESGGQPTFVPFWWTLGFEATLVY